MIKIEKIETHGWEAAIRGMRNPMNSQHMSDSKLTEPIWGIYQYEIGERDLDLMQRLVSAGSDHCKFMRMITVYMDITAPLYFWSQYDTYKVGTVANSCSKMHKIHEKEFTLNDFSHDHLKANNLYVLKLTINHLNTARKRYTETYDKDYWWQMIQLLPSSYNQKRTVMLNYEVLKNIYHARKNHKLDEWHDFCEMIEDLPYCQLITLKEGESHPQD